MGKGRDKRKKNAKKDVESQERKRERQQKKAKKLEEKKMQKDISSTNVDEDLSAKLSSIDVDGASENPSTSTLTARAAGTLTVHPYLESTDIILFGGEYYDGRKNMTYGSLYRYSTSTNTWREVVSQETNKAPGAICYSMQSPSARSGHAAATLSSLGCVVIFGGEYVSPNQKIFQHFSDTWVLRVDKRAAQKSIQNESDGKSTVCYSWHRLDDYKSIKTRPNARSGHRMAPWNNKVILFGGFYDIDSGSSVRYFNDLWILENLEVDSEPQWRLLDDGKSPNTPAPRSGHCLTVHKSECVFVYGGFSVHYPKSTKGSSEKSKQNGIPILHNDLWRYDLQTGLWSVIKAELGIPPSPRCGMSMATSLTKGKSYLFGGVKDEAGSSKSHESQFYNDLFMFDQQTQKFFPISLKKSKELPTEDESKLRTWYPIANHASGVVPCERFNAMLCVLGNNKLYVFGGQRELKDRELTFSDFYSFDLNARTHFTCLIDMDLAQVEWHGKEDEDSEWATTICDDSVSSISTPELQGEQEEQPQEATMCRKEFVPEDNAPSKLTIGALQDHDAALQETERRRRVTFQL